MLAGHCMLGVRRGVALACKGYCSDSNSSQLISNFNHPIHFYLSTWDIKIFDSSLNMLVCDKIFVLHEKAHWPVKVYHKATGLGIYY